MLGMQSWHQCLVAETALSMTHTVVVVIRPAVTPGVETRALQPHGYNCGVPNSKVLVLDAETHTQTPFGSSHGSDSVE
jgi:hypothetical protein